jgi:hypothetical protein
LNFCVIAISNSALSIIAGFPVFCALSHLAYLEGVEVTDLNYGEFSLVFGTWPVVLKTLPRGAHWVRLLFFDLFLLGIDSAFAFMQGKFLSLIHNFRCKMELTVFVLSAFVTVLGDTVLFKDTPKPVLLLLCIIPNFLCSIIYCTDAGPYFLDIIDFNINFVTIMVGFFESFGAAWAYGIPEMRDNIGMSATIAYMIGNFLPVFLACGVWFWVENGDGVWIGFLVLFGG